MKCLVFVDGDDVSNVDNLQALQAKESVEAALHTELHRQIKLAQMDKRHVTASNKLTQWLAEKDTFVATDVAVSSSGEARQQLKQFDSFVKVVNRYLEVIVSHTVSLGMCFHEVRFIDQLEEHWQVPCR